MCRLCCQDHKSIEQPCRRTCYRSLHDQGLSPFCLEDRLAQIEQVEYLDQIVRTVVAVSHDRLDLLAEHKDLNDHISMSPRSEKNDARDKWAH